jgi:hypothetical protein
MVGARGIDRYVNRRVVLRDQTTLREPAFEFLAADVCQHLSIDFNARGKLLAALLNHLQALARIVPDVPVLERKLVLA